MLIHFPFDFGGSGDPLLALGWPVKGAEGDCGFVAFWAEGAGSTGFGGD